MKGALVTIEHPTHPLVDKPGGVSIKTFVSPTGDFSFNADFLNKEIITIVIKDAASNQKFFEQYFFITKGDNILIAENADKRITISGIGAKNNQLKGIPTFYNYGWMKQDSLPDRILQVVNGFYERDKHRIDSLIRTLKPSSEFIEAWNYHLKYARVQAFYNTYGGLRIARRDELERNKQAWLEKLAQLQNEVPLSDEKALVAPSYLAYLDTFLERRHTEIWNDYLKKSPEFYKEWFDGDSLKAREVMQKDFYNALKQKMIERYFSGKVKEQMYAFLFNEMIQSQNFVNLPTILADFNKQFPASKFNRHFKQPLQAALARFNNTLTDKMVFLSYIKNWDNVLAEFKGKTVLLDMWGTWCRPCREELSLHAAALKEHFKTKDITFLYITNHDINTEKWKQLIAFYQLEGVHVFATEDLTKEIMRKVKGDGFPSYAIIDKYGKVEPSKAGYPLDRNVLIEQIEEALGR
ncbi:hypothetical protein GCM10027442_36040 [Emticicia fontis]